MRVSVLSYLLLAFLCISFHVPAVNRVNIINGTVLSASTGKPVPGALVYVVLGEEEALTKAAGSFNIETSHVYPIEVLTEHRDYLKQSVIVKSAADKPVIRLKPREK